MKKKWRDLVAFCRNNSGRQGGAAKIAGAEWLW
jgi:hypothetical protein